MKPGILYAIGLGPGPEDSITNRGLTLLSRCEVVYSFVSEQTTFIPMLERLVGADNVRLRGPRSRKWGDWRDDPFYGAVAAEIRELVDQGKTVGWVCAGDVGIYSPFAYFERYLRAAGVSYEIVPAVSFLNGLAMAADNCLVEESGRLLMARIEDPQELPPLLAVASTVVLYSVGLSLAAGLRDYARREALEAAWLLKVGADRAGSQCIDLLADAKIDFGGTCALKRDPERTMLPACKGPQGSPPRGAYRVDSDVYRRTGDATLRYTAFTPDGKGPHSAVLLFHGGSWGWGHRKQFYPQGATLAQLGVALITFDYRVQTEHDTSPFEAVDDAAFALRWCREQAARLRLDTRRIVVGGGSAGGHIAVWGLLRNAEEACIDPADLACGLLLFNPVTDTSERGFGSDRIPGDPAALDVNLNLRRNMPPSVVFHGTADQSVPFENSIDYCNHTRALGNRCLLHLYNDQPHAFFNYDFKGSSENYYDVLEKSITFLIELGCLPALALAEADRMHQRDRVRRRNDAALAKRAGERDDAGEAQFKLLKQIDRRVARLVKLQDVAKPPSAPAPKPAAGTAATPVAAKPAAPPGDKRPQSTDAQTAPGPDPGSQRQAGASPNGPRRYLAALTRRARRLLRR